VVHNFRKGEISYAKRFVEDFFKLASCIGLKGIEHAQKKRSIVFSNAKDLIYTNTVPKEKNNSQTKLGMQNAEGIKSHLG
jgi:energy-coupling factor transporter ATP-binding protein EcfA2